ncbi:MAG TPA: sortase [Ilumatobacteraceae bacterium]
MADTPEPDQAPDLSPDLTPDLTPAATPAASPAATSAAMMKQAPSHRRRISRWDRPPEPHDWRWIVGHIGRTLITLGLLMFGFVAYQLWGTGIQTARAQSDLRTQLNNGFKAAGISPDTFGTISPTTTSTSAPVATVPITTPAGSVAPPGTPTTPASTTTAAPTTTIAPVPQNYGLVKPGDAIAEIKIPKIDINFLVVAGVGTKQLADGIGHFPNTPAAGQLGNAVFAGHRTTHSHPFLDLDQLKPGDQILVRTKLGGAYVYIVTDSVVVKPTDYHVVTDTDPTKATLTLITCTPPRTATSRLVVHAALDVGASSPVGIGQINYGEGQPFPADTEVAPDGTTVTNATLPGDEEEGATTVATTAGAAPVSSAVSNSDSANSSSANSTSANSTASASASPSTSTASTTADTVPNQFTGDNSAFSQGWFDDAGAWPHVAFWGVLLLLVWYGAYWVAKRRRNLWMALLTGCVPTILVLYFFYENVNRLLPAAL